MYLALRISSIDKLTIENMPIILDETFAYFDQERLKNILEFFRKNYSDKQIIIFTCTKREIEMLEELEIHKNLIEM